MILIKEEFVGGEKYLRALQLGGEAAVVMWLALKAYASKNPRSEGFIPDEDIERLLGAPRRPTKALQALLDCGQRFRDGARGPGLVERVEGGWQLHDYLDHSATPEELELRRERARVKKQRQRAADRHQLEELREVRVAIEGVAAAGDLSPGQQGDRGGHVPRDTQPPPGGDTAGTSLAGAPPPAAAAAHVPSPPLPSPPQPTLKSPGPTSRILEPQAEHRAFAQRHGLDLDTMVRRLNRDPRTAQLSAAEAGKVLQKWLEKAALDAMDAKPAASVGGAA